MQTSGSPRKGRVVQLALGIPILSCALCGVIDKAMEGGARGFWIAFASLLANPLVWLTAAIILVPRYFAMNEDKLLGRLTGLEPGESVGFVDLLHLFDGALFGDSTLIVTDRRLMVVRHSGTILRQIRRDAIRSVSLEARSGSRTSPATLNVVSSSSEEPGLKWVTGGDRLLQHLRASDPPSPQPHV